MPPTGGTAMDTNGDFYFSDLATNSIMRRTAEGKITVLIKDKRLHWVDALAIDDQHRLWLPAAQLDRVAVFHGGRSQIEWPIILFWVPLPETK